MPKDMLNGHFKGILNRESGIGSGLELGAYQELDMNRHEILRLLLVLLSWQMYSSPGKWGRIEHWDESCLIHSSWD